VSIEKITRISGTALPMPGNNVDTDRIIPARYLKAISFEGLEKHLFTDDRAQLEAKGEVHPFSNPAYQGAAVLIVSENFGCGSSREHAPQAIRRRGIRVVIGESFSEIFFGNSAALGMPCVTASPETVAKLMQIVTADPTAPLTVDLEKLTVTTGDRAFSIDLPTPTRDAFLDGSWDATGLLIDRYEQVDDVAAKLPYVAWGR
jgi:3-isopropylmalate/(R)-2-methylmalate dehydratase small subunit